MAIEATYAASASTQSRKTFLRKQVFLSYLSILAYFVTQVAQRRKERKTLLQAKPYSIDFKVTTLHHPQFILHVDFRDFRPSGLKLIELDGTPARSMGLVLMSSIHYFACRSLLEETKLWKGRLGSYSTFRA